MKIDNLISSFNGYEILVIPFALMAALFMIYTAIKAWKAAAQSNDDDDDENIVIEPMTMWYSKKRHGASFIPWPDPEIEPVAVVDRRGEWVVVSKGGVPETHRIDKFVEEYMMDDYSDLEEDVYVAKEPIAQEPEDGFLDIQEPKKASALGMTLTIDGQEYVVQSAKP